MTWERRYRLRHAARTSLVPWALAAVAVALVVSPAARWADRETGWQVFGLSPDGARAVLSALAGSMLTFIVFVLSATLIVVQLASGQLTPRVIAIVYATRWIKVSLAGFAFTFTYTLAALGRVEERVPDLQVGIAVILNLVCILAFFVFVQLLSAGLRPTAMMQVVADRGQGVILTIYPRPYEAAGAERSSTSPPSSGPVTVVPFAGRSGALMAFSSAELARLAARAGAVVELVPQVGDFVAEGDLLFQVRGPAVEVPAAALRGCVAIGAERTLDQDPRFAFRILADIACRALSPGINDPTTAVLALDQIHHLLLVLGHRRIDDGRVHEPGGALRVVYGTPDWGDFVTLAVSEIRQYGDGSLQVNRRLRAMLVHLLDALPPARRPPLAEELAMLDRGVVRRFGDEGDRRRAAVSDYQGVGGSDRVPPAADDSPVAEGGP